MKIKRLLKGQTPTLLETDKGNEVIDAINALGKMSFKRGSKDEIFYSESGITLQLKNQSDSAVSEIDATEYTLLVCENGNAVYKTFYIK